MIVCHVLEFFKLYPNKTLLELNSRKGISWFWKGFVVAVNFIKTNTALFIDNGEEKSLPKAVV